MANPQPKSTPKETAKESPQIVVEDSVVKSPEAPKPVTVTELPNGIKIEDF
jgi:hypothetical protein